MAIRPDAGLVINWPRTEVITSRFMTDSDTQQRKAIAKNLTEIEQLFDDAEAYLAARENNPQQKTDLRYEGMRAVVAGEQPVFVSAASVGQIESVVAFGERRGLKIVIVGGDEAHLAAELLRKHAVPVIVRGLHRLPRRRHADYDEHGKAPGARNVISGNGRFGFGISGGGVATACKGTSLALISQAPRLWDRAAAFLSVGTTT